MYERITALLLCFLAAACGPNYLNATPGEVAAAVTISDTEFDPRIKYVGPAAGSPLAQSVRLRGWRSRASGQLSHQLYVNIYYFRSGWRFYRSVNFAGGSYGEFVLIDRDVSGCSTYGNCGFNETFGVALDDAFLRAHRASGFTVRANARNGHQDLITVPASYVDGYLQAVDAYP